MMWADRGDDNAPPAFGANSNVLSVKSYVAQLRDHSSVLMWDWFDEPELVGVTPSMLRGLTFASHEQDPQHPVAVNVMGGPYSFATDDPNGGWWRDMRRTYTYAYNRIPLGTRRPVADIVGVDYYPLCLARDANNSEMSTLARTLDTIREENYDLLPHMSYVETTDPSNGDPTPWPPSPEQLRMMIWINVVHEVKGINWFHYFPETPAANYSVMHEFVQQIGELAPAVLGPRTNRTVAVSYGQTGRIDTMVREYDGHLYLFAVRVSEVQAQSNALHTPPPPQQDYTLTTTFSLGPGVNGAMEVYGEGRTVSVTNGQFTDTFAPYSVHIYRL
jgi:hypothetical protein